MYYPPFAACVRIYANFFPSPHNKNSELRKIEAQESGRISTYNYIHTTQNVREKK